MAFAFQRLVTLVGLLFAVARANPVINLQTREPSNQQHHDPCAFLAGAKWVAPKDLRACYESFPVDEAVKANVAFLPIFYEKKKQLMKSIFVDSRCCCKNTRLPHFGQLPNPSAESI